MISMGKEPGWFPNNNGELQYWDGENWGPTAPKEEEYRQAQKVEEVNEIEDSVETNSKTQYFEPIGFVGDEKVYKLASDNGPQVVVNNEPTNNNDQKEAIYKVILIILLVLLAIILLPIIFGLIGFIFKVIFALISSFSAVFGFSGGVFTPF